MIRDGSAPVLAGYGPDGLVACHACDAAHRLVPLPRGGEASCRHCGTTLYRERPDSLDRSLALYLAAAILIVLANTFPFMALRYGDRVEQTLLISGGFALEQAGMNGLGVLVILTSVVCPLLSILGMLYLLIPLRLGFSPKWVVPVWRGVRFLTPWGLTGVFMLALLISIVKLQDLAELVPGTAFFAFIGLLVVLAAASASFDPATVWPRLGPRLDDLPAGASAAALGYAVCTVCDLPVSIGNSGSPPACPRCDVPVRGTRRPDSVARTWALLLSAALLLLPANLYPVMTVIRFGQGEPSTILAGVIHLIEEGAWPLALLVFFASFIVPLTKLLALGFLLVSAQRGSRWRLRDRTRLYRVTEAIGAWSMIDVFLVAILVSLVRMDALASVKPELGAMFFAAAVVLTMLAARSFDSRLLWDPARGTA